MCTKALHLPGHEVTGDDAPGILFRVDGCGTDFDPTALALLVTSCTGGTGTDDTAATEAPSPAAEEIVLDDFSAAAVDPAEVIAAVERLRNVPHRSRSFIDFPASGQADELDSDKPVSMYEFDGTWASNTMLLGPGQSSGDPVGFVVSDRSTAYFYIPGAGDAQLPVQASDNPMVDAYDSWIVIDVEQVRAAVPPDLPFRIQGSALDELDEMIETLRGAETAVAGPRSSSCRGRRRRPRPGARRCRG